MTLLEEAYDTPAPNGLGYRVPLLLISPWTRGNIVYSEVTDHISVIKFLEKKFDFTCPNVSPWRRAMTGDLLAAFDFENPDYSWPDLPDTSNYVREADVECLTLPDVVVPTVQKMPVQETGTRVSKALDYRFVVTGGVSEKKLSFKIDNVGGQGAPFVLFDVKNNAAVDPKQYAVEGGKSIDHVVDLVGDDYEYFLYGPNGFVRSWSGSVGEEGGDVHMEYDEGADSVVLVAGAAAGDLTVVDNAYVRERMDTRVKRALFMSERVRATTWRQGRQASPPIAPAPLALNRPLSPCSHSVRGSHSSPPLTGTDSRRRFSRKAKRSRSARKRAATGTTSL